MRLVACPNCKLQLDLSNTEQKSVRCRCGEIVENRSPDGLDLEIHRCSACGGNVVEGAENCGYCGSDIVRNRRNLSLICPTCFARNADNDRFCSGCGLHFEPVNVDDFGEELHCPDCDMGLKARMVGDIRLGECAGCNGLWVPEDRFEALMGRAIEVFQKADTSIQATAAPRMKGANPASQRVQYRKCLVCKHHMQRRNFRKTSGVIIDLCRAHGTWLDADELERIAGFLMSGGRPMADWYLRNESASAQEIVAQQPFTRPMPMVVSSRQSFTSGRRESGGAMGTLLQIFSELLG